MIKNYKMSKNEIFNKFWQWLEVREEEVNRH